MDDDLMRMQELKQQGFYCSQILIILGLELQGKDNPDLVRAAHGLAGGLGFSGELCGALSGGATLLGLYAGKGQPEDAENPRLDFMVMDLVKWFKQEYLPLYGSIRCEDILNGDAKNKTVRCPLLVASTFQKVKDLLVENGFDLSGPEL
jgi:C_GCAxxG_C_C family probable redox protein